jgi:hypothetical protein
MSNVSEVWKPVVGHETTHEVSNLGRVKALPYEMRHWCGKMLPQPERILKDSSHPGGYRTICFRGRGREYVHRVVMAAFVGPGKGMDVNHIDGDKTNNALSNLEYCDRLHNVRHAIRTGLQNNAGENNGCCKYTDDQVRHAISLVVAGDSVATASARLGVSEGMIQQVLGGVRRQYLGLANKGLLAARSQGRGQRHPRASFTEQQVRDIRSSDERTYILAVRYGVSQQCIAGIRSGRTWKHLLQQEAVA